MHRAAALTALVTCGLLTSAAPVPSFRDAKLLVAGLSDPSEKVRDQSTTALQNRADALPWLRRAARSVDQDITRRATNLIVGQDKPRRERAPKAIDACIRDGHADLFIEWHHCWQPSEKDNLWPVGPRMGKVALEAFAKRWPDERNHLEDAIASMYYRGQTYRYHDGPMPDRLESPLWHIRTDRLQVGASDIIAFASVAGPAEVPWLRSGYYFTLGPVGTREALHSVTVCADGLFGIASQFERPGGVRLAGSFVVCRGDVVIPDAVVSHSILLVDGDIDMSRSAELTNCTIRASGRIHLPKDHKPLAKDGKPANCTIEAHAKNATAPYKFFELADVGLSLADDEEGLVVTGVKADTPFGNCGVAKGDLIRAIDDVPAGNSEQFRKAVRRALVRQGDCLLTITRGDKNHDLPVFFPLPK